MKFKAAINPNWKPWKFGVRNDAHFEDGPEFDTEIEVEAWLKEKLDVIYPDQWIYEGQYRHIKGLAGDYLVAKITPIYSDEEKREMHIAALKKTIADAQAELDTLLATAAPQQRHTDYEWVEHPMEPSGKHGDWWRKDVGG